MATPQEEFDLMFKALLNADGHDMKDVIAVARGALRLMVDCKITISDEQLAAMPDCWRRPAISLLFDSFIEYGLKKLRETKTKAEMN